jgi:hypothetical protein
MAARGLSYTDIYVLTVIAGNVIRGLDHTRPTSYATLARQAKVSRDVARESAEHLRKAGYLRSEGKDREELTYWPLLQFPEKSEIATPTAPTANKQKYQTATPRPTTSNSDLCLADDGE